MIRRLRSWYLIHVVLPEMTKRNRESFATRDFVKRREAALKGRAMRQAARAGRPTARAGSRLGLPATIAIAGGSRG